MALTHTNTTLTTTFTSTEIDTNFSETRNKFGSIDNSDIAANAAIAVSKLAASNQEVWLQLRFSALEKGAWPAAPSNAAAPTNNELLDAVALPGSDSDVAWTVTDVSWLCNDTGTSTDATFDIRYGAYNGSGIMTGAGTVVTGATITQTGDDLGDQGRALEGGSVSLTQSSTVRCLYLVSAGAPTSGLDDATASHISWLNVTVALRRAIQA